MILMVHNDPSVIWTALTHFHEIWKILSHQDGYCSITFPELVENSKDEMTMLIFLVKRFGCIPSMMVFYEKLLDLHKISIPSCTKIVMLVADLHHQGDNKTLREANLKKVSRILATYGYAFRKYFNTKIPVWYFPNASVDCVEFNTDPIPKILLSGRLNANIYPFRNMVYQLSHNDSRLEYFNVDHGYRVYENREIYTFGVKFIKKLSEYLASFTCDASYERPYIVGKFFEIAASGSLLIAGNPNTRCYLEDLGFVDGVNYIATTMDGFQTCINWVLDPVNRDQVDMIRRAGYELAVNHHLSKHRAAYLDSILHNDNTKYKLVKNGINGCIYYTPIISYDRSTSNLHESDREQEKQYQI